MTNCKKYSDYGDDKMKNGYQKKRLHETCSFE